MRNAIRLALVTGAIVFAGTALAQPPAAPRGADYFPLAKGMKWVYKVGENDVTVSVVKTEKVGTEDHFQVDTFVGKDAKTGEAKTSEWYVVRPDGMYRTRVKDDAIVPPMKLLPFPVKAGDAWPVNSKLGTQAVKGTMTVRSDRERVTVAAGEFDTVLVEGIDLDIAGAKTTIRIWYARGRGIVKEEFVLQGGQTVGLELAKFEPGEWVAVAAEPAAGPWAFPQSCRIVVRCAVPSVTTQECSGCCARSGRWWVRRR